MANVTYIIPIHKFDKAAKDYFTAAVTSVKNQDDNDYALIVVGPKSILAEAEKVVKDTKFSSDITIKYVENEETDPFVQINKAVQECDTPYFAVLEYDDELSPIWTRNAKAYATNGASLLLPLVELQSAGAFVAFGNELAWDVSFAEETNIGYINSDMLNTFMDFIVSGAFIKTEDFREIGGLKPSLMIAAWYEFLLRCCYKKKDIYVVPKLGYKHNINNSESYSATVKQSLSQEHGAWLLKTAKQEYFFKNDRNRKFGEE